jgi:hypothetical protein
MQLLATSYFVSCYYRSRDSAVGIAIGYGMDDPGVGVRVPVGSRIFSPPRRLNRLWGVKRQGREADHSPPTSAEVKKTWIYTSTPPYALMAQCLVKHSDNFTFIIQYSVQVIYIYLCEG